jgi:protocatechuate 3,4-dioxygenase beta subunit
MARDGNPRPAGQADLAGTDLGQGLPLDSVRGTRPTTEDDISEEVVRRFEAATDPRLRRIMTSLVRHLHAFVKDVELTEAEWFHAIRFLTETGQMCSDKRQEFILLSDTLGVSMVVDLINHRKPDGATESTVFGPFYRDGAPVLPPGGNIAPHDAAGVPTFVTGRVLDLGGQPIEGALLDVWQADSTGRYDSQYAGTDDLHLRGRFLTDAEGHFLIRTVRPVHYPIPTDGPVGRMLHATNRHPWRPAHIHFVVSARGYEPVTTHIFDETDEYLDSDTVFAVKESLVCRFEAHEKVDEAATRFGAQPPFCTASFDFVLKPAGS